MRLARASSVVILSFVLVLSAYAQGPKQDSQAIAILTQCLNAVGGSAAVSGVQDFTAAGTIT